MRERVIRIEKTAPRNWEKPAAAAVLAAAVLLLAHSAQSAESAKDALALCISVIIPSLFPYMVISSLIVRFGAAKHLGRLFSAPVQKLLHLPGCAAGAILLGALCGFPVGARTACELYKRGELTRDEAERLIAVANNTGPAFIIEVIGAQYWGSRGFGAVLYAAQLLSALLIGALMTYRDKKRAPPSQSACVHSTAPRADLLTCLSESVSSASLSVLCVCGFIVFFAVATALTDRLLSGVHLGFLTPYLSSLLEFSNGSSQAAQLGGKAGAFLTGFAVGWSGISVFAQCKAFTAADGIRLRRTAVSKLMQGVLCGLAGMCCIRFFRPFPALACSVISPGNFPYPLLYGEILALVLFCFLPFLFPNRK